MEPTRGGRGRLGGRDRAWRRSPAAASTSECTPGYYNNEEVGEPARRPERQTYAPGINAFNDLLADWREKGDLEGLELIR